MSKTPYEYRQSPDDVQDGQLDAVFFDDVFDGIKTLTVHRACAVGH